MIGRTSKVFFEKGQKLLHLGVYGRGCIGRENSVVHLILEVVIVFSVLRVRGKGDGGTTADISVHVVLVYRL